MAAFPGIATFKWTLVQDAFGNATMQGINLEEAVQVEVLRKSDAGAPAQNARIQDLEIYFQQACAL